MSTGSGVPGTWCRGSTTPTASSVVADPVEGRRADHGRGRGVRRDDPAGCRRGDDDGRQRPGRRPVDDDQRSARVEAGDVAVLVGQPLGGDAGGPPPELPADGVVGGLEEDPVLGDRDHCLDLQPLRGDGLAVDHEPPGVVEVGGDDETAVRQQGRDAVDGVDPDLVGLLEQHRRGAGRRVEPEHERPALVARHHLQDAAGLRPRDPDDVGVRRPVPRHVDAGTVEGQDVQGHLGVVAAGDRVAVLGGRPVGMRRVGDVPPLDRPVVDPGREQGAAVGCPPVAAEPVHLLGGDELRDAPEDLLLLGGGQHLRLRAVRGHHVQRTFGGVRHPGAGRVGSRVDDRAGRRELAHPAAADQVGQPEPAAESEGRNGGVAVGGVADDAAGTLAAALAPRPLGGGQLLLPAREQCVRVGDGRLRPGGHVHRPQRAHRIGVVPGPDEQQPAAGRVEEQAAWCAAREPLGAGVLAGEGAGPGGAGESGVGHPLNLPTRARTVAAPGLGSAT